MNMIEVNIFFPIPSNDPYSLNEIKEFKSMLPCVPNRGDSIGLFIEGDYFYLTVEMAVYYIRSICGTKEHRNSVTLICKMIKDEKLNP